MPKLSCPILKKHLLNGHLLVVNQLFGANKDTTLDGGKVSYGVAGHTGIDIKTTRPFSYEPVNLVWKEDHWEGSVRRVNREKIEANGRIPLIASMDGMLEYYFNPNKQAQGWGIYLTADAEIEDGKTVQYRLLYYHVEAAEHNIGVYETKAESVLRKIAQMIVEKRPRVKRGEKIGVAGDNGMSTGPHLHFQLEKRTKKGLIWGSWSPIDPVPYITADSDIVVQEQEQSALGLKFYRGKLISDAEYTSLTQKWPKVIL